MNKNVMYIVPYVTFDVYLLYLIENLFVEIQELVWLENIKLHRRIKF